ncbi:hypothetical protein [Maricaulis sp. W15]|uniref:hypothetical protein n=1 Tax=Maricaulis sp. W15 TaxID=1772333 RepID=UPI000948B1B9|nr:hypothetical protein [Maricaulis sp. W15]
MTLLRMIAIHLLAVLVGTVLVSIANTHVDLQALARIGAEIPFAVRLDASLRDLQGFAPTLLALLLVGFSIAFPAAGWIAALLGGGIWRPVGFSLAGAVAVMVMITCITLVYRELLGSTITPIAASRELGGLLTLSAGGLVAGLVFAWLKPASR